MVPFDSLCRTASDGVTIEFQEPRSTSPTTCNDAKRKRKSLVPSLSTTWKVPEMCKVDGLQTDDDKYLVHENTTVATSRSARFRISWIASNMQQQKCCSRWEAAETSQPLSYASQGLDEFRRYG
jgi:hypothetical protein